MTTDVSATICRVISQVLSDSGRPIPPLDSATALTTDIGLSSLDLAVLVVTLESEWNIDPFRHGAQPVRTIGELVDVYQAHLSSDEFSEL